MSTPDISTITTLLVACFIVLWRVGVNRRIVKLIDAKVISSLEEALKPIESKLNRHTIQIEGLHGENQTNKHRIIQLVWAGANTVTSAAIWAKQPPRPREVDVAVSDYRRILGEDDLDAS